jgi:hypothetical protein
MVHPVLRQGRAPPEQMIPERENRTMPKEFPLALFPVQLFPDVSLEAVTVDSANKAFTISVADSGWALSQDIEFFFGPGDMVFFFSGKMQMGYKQPTDTTWQGTNNEELLQYLGELEMIKKQSNGTWLFRFANQEKGFLTAIILDDVAKIEWTGEVNEKVYDLFTNDEE